MAATPTHARALAPNFLTELNTDDAIDAMIQFLLSIDEDSTTIATPSLGPKGGVLCTFVDVTRAERAEQELALAETLQQIARDVSSELEIEAVLQKVTDMSFQRSILVVNRGTHDRLYPGHLDLPPWRRSRTEIRP